MKNPKEKGNKYERKIAKLFSEWLGIKDGVWRIDSGSKATNNPQISKYYHGDLIPIHPDVYWFFDIFSIECKDVKLKTLNLLKLFTIGNKKWPFHELWKQAKREAKQSKRIPLLIFHLPNSKFDLIMVDSKYPAIKSFIEKHPIKVFSFNINGHLWLFKLQDLMKYISPKDVQFHFGSSVFYKNDVFFTKIGGNE